MGFPLLETDNLLINGHLARRISSQDMQLGKSEII